jgi:Spy/CpxP family protein refolding chaperone
MRKSTIFLSAATVLVLSAGLVIGRLSAHLPVVTRHFDRGRGWLPDTLELTPDQHQKMDAIWADVKQQMDKNGDHRRALDRERDASIRALLTPQQLTAYDNIFQDYHAHRADLDKERTQLFHTANDRSRALLTPDQQVKWDAMAKDMHDHDHHGPGGPPGRSFGTPSTRPDAMGALNCPIG